MIRRVALFVGVLVLAGIGHALAADIFLKHDGAGTAFKKPDSSEERVPIFVKPNFLKSSKFDERDPAAATRQKDKLNTAALKKRSLEKMASLEDWYESGYQPQTADEIKAFADASRASSQNLMYKRHEKLAAYLEKKEREEAYIIAKKDQAALKLRQKDSGDSDAAQKEDSVDEADEAPHKKVKILQSKPVYHKPDSGAHSSKVFKSTR